MTKPTIECMKNGPLIVKDLETMTDAKGKAYERKQTIALCRCGDSKTKPYCDGSHAGCGFKDEKSDDRTPDKRVSYKGRKITIHDNRGICAHAGFCTALTAVFDPKADPWIDANGETAAQIIEVIKKCPSGALGYSIDDVEQKIEQPSPMIFIAPNGPYAVKGEVELKDVKKGEGAPDDCYDLCRCGDSKNKPFCDGSHHYKKFDEDAPDAKIYER